jgi:hypothetical protein
MSETDYKRGDKVTASDVCLTANPGERGTVACKASHGVYLILWGERTESVECHTTEFNRTPPGKRPAFVVKLEGERDEWKARAEQAEQKIADLLAYLSLAKFNAPEDWVNVADVFARLR